MYISYSYLQVYVDLYSVTPPPNMFHRGCITSASKVNTIINYVQYKSKILEHLVFYIIIIWSKYTCIQTLRKNTS